MNIHPTAIIDPQAVVDDTVEIGPYSLIGKGVRIAEHCKIGSHVIIEDFTIIGKHNQILNGACLGGMPQDKSYDSTSYTENHHNTCLEIGDHNTIREYVTIHHGTQRRTEIGSHNYFMGYSHIAHDCRVKSRVTLANYAGLAGWVEVEDDVFLSGHTLVHQFVRIGRLSMIGGLCRVSQDVPPYALIAQDNGRLFGTNQVGLKRTGWDVDKRMKIKNIYKKLFHPGQSISSGISEIVDLISDSRYQAIKNEAEELIQFIQSSQRGIIAKSARKRI